MQKTTTKHGEQETPPSWLKHIIEVQSRSRFPGEQYFKGPRLLGGKRTSGPEIDINTSGPGAEQVQHTNRNKTERQKQTQMHIISNQNPLGAL